MAEIRHENPTPEQIKAALFHTTEGIFDGQVNFQAEGLPLPYTLVSNAEVEKVILDCLARGVEFNRLAIVRYSPRAETFIDDPRGEDYHLELPRVLSVMRHAHELDAMRLRGAKPHGIQIAYARYEAPEHANSQAHKYLQDYYDARLQSNGFELAGFDLHIRTGPFSYNVCAGTRGNEGLLTVSSHTIKNQGAWDRFKNKFDDDVLKK